MRLRDIFHQRLRSLFSRSTVESDLDEELRYHLERQIELNLAAGMRPAEARQAALRTFADFEQTKEECRDMRKMNLIDELRQDLRFTTRQFAKNRAFTATAILVLALGLCASVAIFAFVDAALIKPLPYPNATRLAGVYESIPQCPRCNLSYLDYLDWKKLNKVYQSLEAYTGAGFIVTTPGGARPSHAARVSAGFFRALGVTLPLGRDFHAGEDLQGAPRTVILSYVTWRNQYAGRSDIVGQTVTLDSLPYVIIGVLPRDFHFAPEGAAEYWTALDPARSCEQRRSCHNLYGVARLKDGVSFQAAQADTVLIARQLEERYPDSNHGQGANVVPLTEVIVGDIRPILLVLLGGAALLLLIACVNIASLLLVRSESRRREMAVRSALGASRARLIRQFVTEGLVLAAAGSTLGMAAAAWATRLLVLLIPEEMMAGMPFLLGLGLNGRVWTFAAAITLLAALVFALTPALRLSFMEMRDGLAEGSRGSAGNTWRRLGARLVVVELATAMVLLVGAGLLGQSLYRLLRVAIGFRPDHLVTMEVDAPDATYGKDPQAVALGRQLLDRVSNLPGVKSAGLVSVLPVNFNGNTDWIRFVGKPYNGEHNEVNERDVSADFFPTLKAKLLRGRYFTEADDQSKPNVAVINQTLARKYFPGEDPVGKQYGDISLSPKSIRTIIGVVEDIREGQLDSEIWPAEYLPFNQSPDTYFNLVVRTSQAGLSILPSLTATIHGIDRGIVVLGGASMEKRIEDSPSAYIRRSSAWLVGGFAAVALLLGVVGLYGVIAYSVGQRTREIGVRIALGAERKSVYGLVLKEAGSLAVIGILAGVLASLLATKLLRKLLFGIQSWDIPTLIAVAVVLAVATLLASYIPARRAASVNPVEALRAE
ncbi:MAG: ABC transporter permease [Bryobacteraceae bacterium]|jgi:predicted permease